VGNEWFEKSCDVIIEKALLLRSGIRFRELVPEMDFLHRSLHYWPGAMHRTLVSVGEEDFAKIEQAFAERTSRAVN
jgi:hypothetical protein